MSIILHDIEFVANPITRRIIPVNMAIEAKVEQLTDAQIAAIQAENTAIYTVAERENMRERREIAKSGGEDPLAGTSVDAD